VDDFDREFTRFLAGVMVIILAIAAVCWTVRLGLYVLGSF